MFTLSILIYVVISLSIARHKYSNVKIKNLNWNNENPCYQNRKKSLIYGFVFLPAWVVGIYGLIVVSIGFIRILIWIFKNMP